MTNKEFLELYGNNEIDKDLLDMYIKIEEKSRESSYLVYNNYYGVIEKDCVSYEEAVYTDNYEFICWLDDYDHIVNHSDLDIELPKEYREEYIKLFNMGEYNG
jgi:hypothetical protein